MLKIDMSDIGLYVRCPYDEETDNIVDSRTFYYGQIVEINEEKNLAKVNFYDPLELRNFFTTIPYFHFFDPKYLVRTPALMNSVVIFKEKKVKIVAIASKPSDEKKFYTYYVEYQNNGKTHIGEVSERQIQIPFTRADYNPINQMIRYEFQSPRWFSKRRIVSKSMNIIDNSPSGFKNLLGTRVHLFTHQFDTVMRALADNPCRLMLADEVGLGKTIEALSIIKGKKDSKPKLRSLIIVPESLIHQWQAEMSFKFWMDVPIWDKYSSKDESTVLISLEDYQYFYDEIINLPDFDICIIDETHKLLNNDNLYSKILRLCKSVENILLLSATPILNRHEEYKKLLTLLNPYRFESMISSDFNNLLSKQRNIVDIVYDLLSDLEDYIDADLFDNYKESLLEINDKINDPKLAELINNMDSAAEDKGLQIVKIALAYISEFYQIERGIIRHRRIEVPGADIKRELIEVPYEMAGSDIDVYEENCYNAVLDFADMLIEKKNNVNLAKLLLSAASSSPYALLDLINSNRFGSEIQYIEEYVLKWKKSVDKEISNIKNVSDDIDNYHSKFSKIIDYIDQDDVLMNKKYLIFTGFTATAKELEKCFLNFFGEKTTCAFLKDMEPQEMHNSASLFQNNSSYRFMICDESGGEGRNFQIADFIIHFDLPWTPAVLEQRIGRLDRIGRDINKKVTSVVFYSSDSIENHLFNVYSKGLGIFNESLCGMEITFEDIQKTIENALIQDIRFGLSKIVNEIKEYTEKMNEEVDKERYFDKSRQLDLNLHKEIEELINHFTNNDGKELMNTMLAWPALAGFKGVESEDAFNDGGQVISIDVTKMSIKAMKNAVYFPPRMDEIIKRSKYKNDIRGTFSRDTAIKHEDLTFFAPFNTFFDSITNNAEECYKGRSVAFKYKECDIEYVGLLFTWNIKYNPLEIYKKNYTPDMIGLIKKYITRDQFVFSIPYSKKYCEISHFQIIDEIDKQYYRNPIHLGKRDNKMINKFKERFPKENWMKYLSNSYKKAYKEVKLNAQELINLGEAKNELEKILIANKAREIFYEYSNNNSIIKNTDEIQSLLWGLENPIIELDSVAFVILEKKE